MDQISTSDTYQQWELCSGSSKLSTVFGLLRANPSTFHVIQEDDSDSESDDDDDDDDDESDEDSEDDLGRLTYFCRYGSISVTELFPLFLLYFSLA